MIVKGAQLNFEYMGVGGWGWGGWGVRVSCDRVAKSCDTTATNAKATLLQSHCDMG